MEYLIGNDGIIHCLDHDGSILKTIFKQEESIVNNKDLFGAGALGR